MQQPVRAARLQSGETLDPIHFVLLHQELDALGVLGDDFVLAVENFGVIELRILALNALFGGVLEVFPNVGRVQQRFGGDAADVQAGAAQLGSFSMTAVLRPYWPARTAAE